MLRWPQLTAPVRWGTALALAGAMLLVVVLLATPAFLARHLSPDGRLTAIGLEQVSVARRMLGAWGLVAILTGSALLLAPAGIRASTERLLLVRGRGLVIAGLVLFFGLFTFNSVFRTARLSPDSMNYIDVARHISQGHGVVQSTLGFNQNAIDPAATIPVPFSIQPPLYPILVALAARTGMEHARAAHLVSATGLVLLLGLLTGLAQRLYGPKGSWLALAIVLTYQPLHWVASYAWSETTCLALAAGAFVLLLEARHPGRWGLISGAAAGILTGLAITTRYSVTPLALVGPVVLLLQPGSRRSRLASAAAYGGGLAVALAPLVLRNRSLAGHVVPNHIPPFNTSIPGEISGAAVAIFGRYAGIHPLIELPLALIGIGVLLILLRRRGELIGALHGAVSGSSRWLPVAWAVLYVGFVVAVKTVAFVEPFGPRLILPASVFLLLPLAFLVERAWRPDRVRVVAMVLGVLVLKIAGEVVLLQSEATFRHADPVAASERLSWVAAQTTDRDLILGDDTMDIPFWLGRRAAVSFSPFPQTSHATYDTLREVCRRRTDSYDRFFIVLRNNCATDAEWQQVYGPFIADLVAGRLDRYAGVRAVADLADGHVYEIQP